ncbi:MAG: hypothetical protein H6998_13525 [Hahellaceae bacterium]|nr:hypothetical protein [Hahellaceae bacterium]
MTRKISKQILFDFFETTLFASFSFAIRGNHLDLANLFTAKTLDFT